MNRFRGLELPLPLGMNRSRAAALLATLVLHVVAIAWLLMLRFEIPPALPVDAQLVWLPEVLPVPPPAPLERPPVPPTANTPDRVPLLIPELPTLVAEPDADWFGDARDVAGSIGTGPTRHRFGETPKAPAGRPKEEYPPSIYEKPLERVGKAYRTPEGEQILWVSDHCFISLGTQSLTMADFHKARAGIRRCNIALGKREPRGDLFDHLKRPNKEPP